MRSHPIAGKSSLTREVVPGMGRLRVLWLLMLSLPGTGRAAGRSSPARPPSPPGLSPCRAQHCECICIYIYIYTGSLGIYGKSAHAWQVCPCRGSIHIYLNIKITNQKFIPVIVNPFCFVVLQSVGFHYNR